MIGQFFLVDENRDQLRSVLRLEIKRVVKVSHSSVRVEGQVTHTNKVSVGACR